jgi:hypothetical protein
MCSPTAELNNTATSTRRWPPDWLSYVILTIGQQLRMHFVHNGLESLLDEVADLIWLQLVTASRSRDVDQGWRHQRLQHASDRDCDESI